MDWEIRIALIVTGLLVIGFIFFDFSRKKKKQEEKQRLIEQMRVSSEQVDSAGYDYVGVGSPRKKNNASGDDRANPVNDAGTKMSNTKVSDTKVSDTKVPDNNAYEQEPESAAGSIQVDSNESSTPERNKIRSESDVAEQVLSLILKADEGTTFKGSEFLPLLLSQGLRHGEMGIFHRHAGASGKPGSVIYSVANAINPGTFDLKNIEIFETPAFAFFLTLPGPEDSIIAYEGMIRTMMLLKKELGGEVLDEDKIPYTEEKHFSQIEKIQNNLTETSC